MKYLESRYELGRVTPAYYRVNAEIFANLQITHGLEATVRTSAPDYPELADHIIMYGNHLQEAYCEGGGFYIVALAVGLLALRQPAPGHKAKQLIEADWEAAVAREGELTGRFVVRTLEDISAIGLSEVSEVNAGYVVGYQAAFQTPRLYPFIGFSGLGALHAHDLMHFASVRN